MTHVGWPAAFAAPRLIDQAQLIFNSSDKCGCRSIRRTRTRKHRVDNSHHEPEGIFETGGGARVDESSANSNMGGGEGVDETSGNSNSGHGSDADGSLMAVRSAMLPPFGRAT